jgi:hypothetical protein
MNKKIVIGTVIGLVIGLVLGIFVSVLFNLPSAFHTGVGVNNQVQVSGTVSETQSGTITFVNAQALGNSSALKLTTSSLIVNGGYSVILIGGNSYIVHVSYTDSYGRTEGNDYTLYAPLGVTTYTANF